MEAGPWQVFKFALCRLLVANVEETSVLLAAIEMQNKLQMTQTQAEEDYVALTGVPRVAARTASAACRWRTAPRD